jgi:hypothetical protein
VPSASIATATTGISKIPEVPNLAGQNPAYLLEQIRKFGSGERKDPVHAGLIKVLKDEERVQIALFYATKPVKPSKADAWPGAKGKDAVRPGCAFAVMARQARGNDYRTPCRPAKAPLSESLDHPLSRQYRRSQQPADVHRHRLT